MRNSRRIKNTWLTESAVQGKINILPLRRFALEELPRNWPLREILLAETERIDAITFIARLPLWLKLSNLKGVSSK